MDIYFARTIIHPRNPDMESTNNKKPVSKPLIFLIIIGITVALVALAGLGIGIYFIAQTSKTTTTSTTSKFRLIIDRKPNKERDIERKLCKLS